MKCPLCEADTEPIYLHAIGGGTVEAKRCTQCSGIWFAKGLQEQLDPGTVERYDSAAPNYSARYSDLICPTDRTLLARSDHDINPQGGQYWQCPECSGSFFPKGQLALFSHWQQKNQPQHAKSFSSLSAKQTTGSIISLFGLVVLVLASLNRLDLQAASAQTLPTAGPNLLTLVLLALTYLAGTVLAVLGRKLPIILLGWGVITVCLVGFSVIIFGP